MTTTNPRAVIGGNQPPPLQEVLADRYADLTKKAKAWVKRAEKVDLSPKTMDDVLALQKLWTDGQALVRVAEDAHKKEKEPFLRDGKTVDSFFNKDIRDAINAVGNRVKQAALKRQGQLAEEEQAKQKAEAAKLERQAQAESEKAQRAEDRGDIKQADIYDGRAASAASDAAAAQAAANADLRDASRQTIGGISSAVGKETVCIGVNKAEIDLEALRPFLKPDDLVEAVNKLIKAGNPPPKGAITEEQYKGSIRRR